MESAKTETKLEENNNSHVNSTVMNKTNKNTSEITGKCRKSEHIPGQNKILIMGVPIHTVKVSIMSFLDLATKDEVTITELETL